MYVVVKCGSAARGDVNEHSDVDFVCIHGEGDVPIASLKRQYPQISFLSLELIYHMKVKGSLFLAHLDVDGSVVEGDKSLLSVIAGFRPTQSTLRTNIESTQNFLVAIEWFPTSYLGTLWLHDVLYVAFRNILYCSNALHSIFCFSLSEAMEAFGFSADQVQTMYRVRQGKYTFRSMTLDTDGTWDCDIKSLSSLATLLSKAYVSFRMGGFTDWTRSWKYDYWDERLVERAIINREVRDNGFCDLLKDHNYNRRVLPDVIRKYVTGAQRSPSHLQG